MASFQRFTWSAQDVRGRTQQGELTARNRRTALAALRTQGWLGIELRSVLAPSWRAARTTGARDTTVLTRQLATLLGADVPLLSALVLMRETTPQAHTLALLEQLHRDIRGGSSLTQALSQHPKQFDPLYRHVVSAGEASGSLGLLLDRLATQRERHESLRAQLRSALVYPLAVVLVAVAVVAVILVWVVPTFESVYGGFGASLPALTLGLLGLSRGLVEHAPLLGLVLVLLVVALARLRHAPWAVAAWDRWSLHWPVVGRLRQRAATARWTRTLSTLLDAGTPLNTALVSVAGASGHCTFELASLAMAQAVREGSALTPAMKRCGLFDPVVLQLTAMGEASGTLSTLLSKAAHLSERELETQLQGLSGLIEPVIIVVLGLVIGTIVLALYWPIFELGQVI
jgi:type IV pilus assembly protein PilC